MTSPNILINNAGINMVANFGEIEPGDFDRMHRINVAAPMMLCKAVLPAMRAKGWGRIVNISSIWGKTGRAGRAGYAATKFGLDGMTASLAAEVAADGVLANCVAPVPYRPYFSVDGPADADKVEALIRQDPLWGKY